MLSRKLLYAVIGLSLLIASVMLIWLKGFSAVHQDASTKPSAVASNENSSIESLHKKTDLEPPVSSSQPPLPDSELERFTNLVESMKVLKLELKEVMGDYDKNELVGYEAYAEPLLISLAKAGDLKAIYLLIQRNKKSGNKAAERSYVIDSILHGGLYGFDELMFINVNLYAQTKDINIALEGLAWMKAKEYRGVYIFDEYVDTFYRLYDKDLYTPENRQKVIDLSKQLFSQIESQRQKMNLPEFDNRKTEQMMGAFRATLELDQKYTLPQMEGEFEKPYRTVKDLVPKH